MKIFIIILSSVAILVLLVSLIQYKRSVFSLSRSDREFNEPIDLIKIMKVGLLAYKGYWVYEIGKDDRSEFIISMNNGIRKVDAASNAGAPMAWAPMGFIEIDHKRFPWWCDGNEDKAYRSLKDRTDGHLESENSANQALHQSP